MDKFFKTQIAGKEVLLPVLPLGRNQTVPFFNLHGDSELIEHCGKEVAKLLKGCDIILTGETKGLELAHVAARELGMRYYAVAYKSKKSYIREGLTISVETSSTIRKRKKYYLSKRDVALLNGKKVGILDDVICTGRSLKSLTRLAEKAGGTVYKKVFVLAEGDANKMDGISYLAYIPSL